MSATLAANVTVTGNLPAATNFYPADISSTGGLNLFQSTVAPNGIGPGPMAYHTAMVMNDGTVRVCGLNSSGQLGQNDLNNRSTVVSVLGISSQAIAVACGGNHTAILMNDGTVRICGFNSSGQLGQNDLNNRSTVVSVLGISSQAIAVACGVSHTAILMNDGTVRVCGANSQCQLGQNDTAIRSTVVSVLGISSQAVAVACGQAYTVILLNDGTVRVCGNNGSGQLGQNDLNNRSTVVPVLGISSQAIAIAGGQAHTVILLNDGTVRACGRNTTTGQLGQNDTVNRSTVVPVLGISSQAIAVACGRYHTAILMNNGTVRVCGANANGQLGQNDTANRSTVVPVLGISSQAIVVAGGAYQTTILMNDGTVRVCGRNAYGQLGQNDLVYRSTVVPALNVPAPTPPQFITGSLLYASSNVGPGPLTYHTAIVMSDGTVRVCGLNGNGQLGQNDTANRSTVVSVIGISSQAIAVACGQFHTAILMNNGTVRVCGRNANGQLGQNDTVNRSTVVPVLGISSQAIAVACGQYFTAILLNNGTVRVCGLNSNGQLGLNDLNDRSTVVSVLGISSQAVAIGCGSANMGIIINDGTVRVCGYNSFGHLGQNDLNTRSTVVSVLGISSQAIAVAQGGGFTAVLMNDGTLRTVGLNNLGQLGTGDTITRSTVVSVLGISSQATGIAVGQNHTIILMNDGTVRICGYNSSGQLGQNDTVNRSTVVPVPGFSSQAVAVMGGFAHTAILLNDGTVRVCGANGSGQLGQNDVITRSTVVPVLASNPLLCYTSGGNNAGVSVIGTGPMAYHTALVMNDGTVRACGNNGSGPLGQNDVANRSTVVSVFGISSQAIAIACGQFYTAILMNNGTVRVCGLNGNGQLGQNDLVNRSTVIPVLGISSQAIAVACGLSHMAILLNDGTVRVCGYNAFGQLGQNDLVQRSTVVPVLGISSQAIAVACGRYHTTILMNDGTVRVCGVNASGQLGQNDTVNRSTVVPVLGISSQAIAVACGSSHTAILLNDGTVRVCGVNANGQLGQNDLVNRSTVVSVLGISSQAIAVACGRYHTTILMNDGTVRVCGQNSSGQLGQNNTASKRTAVPVLGISSQAIAVACGYYQTVILMNDGTVRVCGQNINGQLGQNDTVNRSTIVSVLGIMTSPYLNMGALSLGLISTSYQLDLSTDSARKLSTSTWFTGSDERIKTNIQTANLQRCSEIIDALDLKYFKWAIQSNDKHALGWIAQDVEQIFPKSVETDPVTGTKMLNSDQLIKVMYGSLKNMIQKTYPPTAVGDGSSTQASATTTSVPDAVPNQ